MPANLTRTPRTSRRSRTILGVFLLAQGCASSFDPQARFEDVRSIVSQRGVGPIDWRPTSSPEEWPLEEALTKLLSSPLDCKDAVRIALLNNRGLQAIYEELGVAEVELLRAGLLQNPVFSVERRFSGKALELDVAQGFLEVFFIPLKKRVAQRQLSAAKLRVADAVLAHAARTESAFMEHEAARRTESTLRTALQIHEASVAASSELNRAGNVAVLDVLNEKARRVQARLELSQAELDVKAARERLNVLMGLFSKDAAGWRTRAALPSLPKEEPNDAELERLALERRLDLKGEKEELLAIEEGLGATGLVSTFLGTALAAHFEREASDEESVGPSLSIPLPLFDQGRASKEAGLIALRRAASSYLQHAVEARSEVRAAAAKVQSARARAAFANDELLPLRRRILQESLRQYNGMFLGPKELLEARREELLAERTQTEALKDYWVAKVALSRALGGSGAAPESGKSAPNEPASEEDARPIHHHH